MDRNISLPDIVHRVRVLCSLVLQCSRDQNLMFRESADVTFCEVYPDPEWGQSVGYRLENKRRGFCLRALSYLPETTPDPMQ